MQSPLHYPPLTIHTNDIAHIDIDTMVGLIHGLVVVVVVVVVVGGGGGGGRGEEDA